MSFSIIEFFFMFSEFDMEQFQAEQAALKIQAAFRGHRARRMVSAKRKEKNGNCVVLMGVVKLMD